MTPNNSLEPFLARTAENAIRIATILAIGRRQHDGRRRRHDMGAGFYNVGDPADG